MRAECLVCYADVSMKIQKVFRWFGVYLLIGITNLFGQQADRTEQVRQILAELKWVDGSVVLGSGIASLNLTSKFRYLGPEDARKVLVDIWGNPPDRAKTLGMIFPADMSPVAPASWAVVITYGEDGYVKDDDAAKINYDQLLAQMRQQVSAENEQRAKEHFPSVELIGWAVPPRYDRENHKLYWAKELSFSDAEVHTLNYGIRVLGRKGVLAVNAVASMEQLAQIEEQMPEIMSMVNFTAGNRYTDYQQGNDKVAEYGLAALILGGVAAKAGLLKGLLVLLAASWKFIAVAVVAAGGFVARLFRRLKPEAGSQKPGVPKYLDR
jgi:uncharacterized membrane-anchored protein